MSELSITDRVLGGCLESIIDFREDFKFYKVECTFRDIDLGGGKQQVLKGIPKWYATTPNAAMLLWLCANDVIPMDVCFKYDTFNIDDAVGLHSVGISELVENLELVQYAFPRDPYEKKVKALFDPVLTSKSINTSFIDENYNECIPNYVILRKSPYLKPEAARITRNKIFPNFVMVQRDHAIESLSCSYAIEEQDMPFSRPVDIPIKSIYIVPGQTRIGDSRPENELLYWTYETVTE